MSTCQHASKALRHEQRPLPQGAPNQQQIWGWENHLHARNVQPLWREKEERFTTHVPPSSQRTLPTISPAPWSWRGNHGPETLRGGRTGLGSRRPGQGQGTRLYACTQHTARHDLLNRGRGHHASHRPYVTYGHNLLPKIKLQGCLLVGRPFLHHACRHTSMA